MFISTVGQQLGYRKTVSLFIDRDKCDFRMIFCQYDLNHIYLSCCWLAVFFQLTKTRTKIIVNEKVNVSVTKTKTKTNEYQKTKTKRENKNENKTKKCMITRKCNNWLLCSWKTSCQCIFTFAQMFLLTCVISSVPTAINSLTSPDLLRLAQDLTIAPASHAYCEQIFTCGELTAGWRNQLIVIHCAWGSSFKWTWVAEKLTYLWSYHQHGFDTKLLFSCMPTEYIVIPLCCKVQSIFSVEHCCCQWQNSLWDYLHNGIFPMHSLLNMCNLKHMLSGWVKFHTLKKNWN